LDCNVVSRLWSIHCSQALFLTTLEIQIITESFRQKSIPTTLDSILRF